MTQKNGISAWQNRIGWIWPPLGGYFFGRTGLSFGRKKLLAPPKKWPRNAYALDTVLWRINEKNIYFDSFLIIKYWRAHAKFHEIMRCRSAINDRYQNIFKEKNGLGDNLYLSFLDIKISRDQPLQHSTIWIQFCSCRLYRESKKVSYWKNGHITTFKLIQKAKAGVVLEFRILATLPKNRWNSLLTVFIDHLLLFMYFLLPKRLSAAI